MCTNTAFKQKVFRRKGYVVSKSYSRLSKSYSKLCQFHGTLSKVHHLLVVNTYPHIFFLFIILQTYLSDWNFINNNYLKQCFSPQNNLNLSYLYSLCSQFSTCPMKVLLHLWMAKLLWVPHKGCSTQLECYKVKRSFSSGSKILSHGLISSSFPSHPYNSLVRTLEREYLPKGKRKILNIPCLHGILLLSTSLSFPKFW